MLSGRRLRRLSGTARYSRAVWRPSVNVVSAQNIYADTVSARMLHERGAIDVTTILIESAETHQTSRQVMIRWQGIGRGVCTVCSQISGSCSNARSRLRI